MLFTIHGKRQCGELLEPARLPHVLDVTHGGGVADVQRSGEAALDLPSVAVVTMPVELESQGKLEIEHMNALHRRTATVQLYGIGAGLQRHPARRWHGRLFFPEGPVNGKRRRRASAPA